MGAKQEVRAAVTSRVDVLVDLLRHPLLLFTAGARLLPVAETSLIGMLETVLGPLWVWLVLGEEIGVRSIVGGMVILSALALHTLLDLAQRTR